MRFTALPAAPFYYLAICETRLYREFAALLGPARLSNVVISGE